MAMSWGNFFAAFPRISLQTKVGLFVVLAMSWAKFFSKTAPDLNSERVLGFWAKIVTGSENPATPVV